MTALASAKGSLSGGVSLGVMVTSLSQRYAAFVAYNDMIQRLGANHVEGVLEGGGQRAIGLAGFGISRRMVMHQYHGCCVVL